MILAKSYKICFLLGSPDISGGTYVIFEHASRLQKMGHCVSVATRKYVKPDRHAWHPEAGSLEWLTIEEASSKEFDLLIATWWESPYHLFEIPASHHVYFVQSIETKFFEQADLTHHNERDLDVWKDYCEATYSMNIPMITEATWIKQYLYDNYNHHPFLVHNGIRKDIYTLDGEAISSREPGKLRVLIEGPVDVDYKNVPTSIELCKKAQVDEVWLLTSSDITEIEGVDRVFSRVPIHETPAIYRSCDVLVKLSYIEGMFGPPLEMFHCGGTSIVYDVTGHDEYIVDNKNSYVVARDNEEQVIEYLKKLKQDPEELKRLQSGARETAASWPDWQASAIRFNDAVFEIMKLPGGNPKYLEKFYHDSLANCYSKVRFKDVNIFREREEAEEQRIIDNFIQAYYWAEADGLDPENFEWAHYKSGQIQTVSVELPITGFPFWIRLDPSVRMGGLEVFSIQAKDKQTGNVLFNIESPDDFKKLWVGGTQKKLPTEHRNVFYAFGNDPQFILPSINDGEIGQKITVEITLKEGGILELIDQVFNVAPEVSVPQMSVSLSRRILRKAKHEVKRRVQH